MRFPRCHVPAAVLMLLCLCACASQRQAVAPPASPAPSAPAAFQLQVGDLLFQDLDGGPLCDAIETVTSGYHHARLSHVGMVVSDGSMGEAAGDQVQVIEAVGSGVKLTPLDQFLRRSHDAAAQPKVLVGRLKPPYRPLIRPAVDFAMSQRGKPYDKLFAMRDGQSYYCSSLISAAFRQANHGQALFQPAPMTFKDPATAQYFPAWVDYFSNLHAPIPEGQPGVNPGAMSRAQCIEIIHAYGQPSLGN